MKEPPATVLITVKRDIWRVTVDGVFYGDYRSQRHAAESAEAAASAIRDRGRIANIVSEASAP